MACGTTPIDERRKACNCCGALLPAFVPDPIHHDCQPRGLGDTIAKMTAAVGIEPCGGCEERQAWLNRKFGYRKSGR